MHKHARLGGSGGMFPQEIRCSEIASEAILAQKQSGSSYMARGVLHPIFGCPCIFAKPVDFEFLREKVRTKVGRTAGGVTSLEGQLSSA